MDCINYNNIYSKLDLSKNETLKKVIVSDLTTKKNLGNIMSQIALGNSKNDTSEINFYLVKNQRDNQIKDLTPLFCDNILIYGLTLKSRCTNKFCKDTSIYNRLLHMFFSDVGYNLSGREVKAVGITGDFKREISIEQKEQYYKDFNISKSNNDIFLLQKFKLSLADIDINKIYNIFNKDNIKWLTSKGLYLYDIDLTTDIKGCFNKDNLIKHLIKNYNFKIQEDTIDNGDDKEEEEAADNIFNNHIRQATIINNNKTVGRHCLSFITTSINGLQLRLKFYNKFVQSLETGSVRENIGSHISNWVNNREDRLRQTIKNCLDSGLLRLEITYNLIGSYSLPKIDDINKDITFLKDVLQTADNNTYFYCPISEQYKQYTTIIKESLIVICPQYYRVLAIRSINFETQKINGIGYLNRPVDKRTIEKIICRGLFNRPYKILVLEIDQEEDTIDNEGKQNQEKEEETKIKLKKNATITIWCKNFNKIDNTELDGYSLLVNKRICEIEEQAIFNKPQDMGIIEYNNIKWLVPTKDNRNDKFKYIYFQEAEGCKDINLTHFKLIKKQKQQEEQKQQDEEELLKIQKQQEELNKKFKIEEEQKKKFNNMLENIYNKYYGNIRKTNSLKDVNNAQIIAFRKINSKYGESFILMDVELKTYYANQQIYAYLDKVINNEDNKPNIYMYRDFYYCSLSKYEITPVITLNNPVEYTTKSNHKGYQLNITANKKLRQIKEEDQEEDYNNILKIEGPNVKDSKIKQIKPLEDLQQNREYRILELSRKPYRGLNKYALHILDVKKNIILGVFKSSYFLEQELNKLDLEQELNKLDLDITRPSIIFKSGLLRNTPNNNKALMCYINTNI